MSGAAVRPMRLSEVGMRVDHPLETPDDHLRMLGADRALAAAGFRYVRTEVCRPHPIDFEQAITRWVLERPR